MLPDDAELTEAYDVTLINVHSSDQISTRVTAVVSKLTESERQDGKTPLVKLTGKAKMANKLISIVEIAKRDLASKSLAVYQYNALTTELVDINRRAASNNTLENDPEKPQDDSDSAFETMGAANAELTKKKRAVPIMTIYLVSKPVRELRLRFGEQRS